MAKKIIIEHPALFLGELRDDLVRVSAIDEETNERCFIRVKGDEKNETKCIETLIPFENYEEYEIIEE